MGAPAKPRARREKNTNKARIGSQNAIWRLWNDPATRPMMLERARRPKPNAGRPPGVADGYRKEQIAVLRVKAEKDAERIVTSMEEEGMIEPLALEALKAVREADEIVDNEAAAARLALKQAITLILMPGNVKDKLTAIRTVLEWTKAKPATTSNTNLSAAEAFLDALAKKDAK